MIRITVHYLGTTSVRVAVRKNALAAKKWIRQELQANPNVTFRVVEVTERERPDLLPTAEEIAEWRAWRETRAKRAAAKAAEAQIEALRLEQERITAKLRALTGGEA